MLSPNAPPASSSQADPEFTDTRGGWAPRFEGRTLTSFEAKAHKVGRKIFDLAARKI